MNEQTNICIYTDTHTRVCVCVCRYVCTDVLCMYVRTYVLCMLVGRYVGMNLSLSLSLSLSLCVCVCLNLSYITFVCSGEARLSIQLAGVSGDDSRQNSYSLPPLQRRHQRARWDGPLPVTVGRSYQIPNKRQSGIGR